MGELSDYMRDMINMHNTQVFETDCLVVEKGSEVSLSVVQKAAMELMTTDPNNVEAFHSALANFSTRFIHCDGSNVHSFENLDEYLCQILLTPHTVFTLQHVLTSMIAYLEKFPDNAEKFMDQNVIEFILQLVANDQTDSRSVCLSLNVINRLTVINPEIRIVLYAHNFIKTLINRINYCEEIEIKNECWLCSWSILHTNPHPIFEQIQEFTPFLQSIFESPDDPCFMKKIMLISAFVECSKNTAFIATNYISISDAIGLLFSVPAESQYVIFELLISLMDSGEMTIISIILSGLTWDWFPFIAQNSTEENKISAVRFATTVFLSGASDECIIEAIEKEVFDYLFGFIKDSQYILLKWSALAVLSALRNHCTILFNIYFDDFDFLEKCIKFLDMSSTRVAKHTGLCLQSVFLICERNNHYLANVFNDHELPNLLEELIEDPTQEICSDVADAILDIREELLSQS